VYAYRAGYEKLAGVDYDIVGNLDADVTFDPEQFAFLLTKFAEDPTLGVAGTPFVEGEQRYNYRFTSLNHVSGCCQLFRRECFEEIGGYTPIAVGGIDLVAVLSARQKGWKTRTFPEKVCVHHRKIGTAEQSRLMVAFRGGKGDFRLGMHPLWELCRTPYQMIKPPIVLAGGLRLAGFVLAMFGRADKLIPADLVHFRRREQMQRLRRFVVSLLRFGKSHPVPLGQAGVNNL
jgi:GT2 family glycosyltransferase